VADRLVQEPYLYVEIDNKDVSAYITPYLTSFTYLDNDGIHEKESDDIEIELEDTLSFFRDKPPARGSVLKVRFGYTNKIRDAGVFYIDGFTYTSSREGDKFTIKALTKDVQKSFQEVKTQAFENTTLKRIAEDIAKKQGYKLDFKGDDVAFDRLTQNQKRDLQFLAEICNLYGYTCKTSNKTIVIRSLEERLGSNTIYVLTRDVVKEFSFEVSSIFESGIDVEYLDPNKKAVVGDKAQAKVKASGSTKKIRKRVDSKKQAEKITQAQKKQNEMKEIQASITSIGIPELYAGGKIEIKGFGRFDMVYYISAATHKVTRNGYETELKLLKGAV